jgi:hypothetical protein
MTPAAPAAVPARRAIPGDLLLGIVPLAAIALLVLNDHVLKAVWPGDVTGKLSDGAGLVFFPFLLVAVWQLVAGHWGRGVGLTSVVVAVAATGVVFTLAKATGAGDDLYRVAFGVARWPLDVVAAVLGGQPIEPPRRVAFVADPTDLAMLPALAVPLGIGIARRAIGWGSVRAHLGVHPEDGPVAALVVAMFLGAVVDGWAHTHLPSALETILTPWHAIVYTAFALLVAVVAGGMAVRRREHPTASLRSLVPAGYGATVVGIGLFLAAGLADSGWHLLFGIEADAEALVSPTHLLLGVGAGLLASGPVRAAWLAGLGARWPALLPAVLAVGAATGLLAFGTHVAHPLVDPWPVYPYDATSPTYWATAQLGIASVGLQAAILAGGLTVVLRAWPAPPAGALGLVVVLATAPLLPLHDQTRFLPVVLLAALAVEAARALVPPRHRAWTAAIVGAVGPAVLWIGEVAILVGTGENRWSAHLLGGGLVVAVVSGGLVGWLAGLPVAPSRSEPA